MYFILVMGSSYSYEVVVVEDSSPDGTYEVALELQVGKIGEISVNYV